MKSDGQQDAPMLVSDYRDSIDVLLRARFLDPPSRPGLLACLDRFEVLRVVGVGGMGVVVLAREAALEAAPSPPPGQIDPAAPFDKPRLFAIKMLKPELAGSLRAAQQFVSEVRHMECLTHAHILPVLEVSEQSQRPQIRRPSEKGAPVMCPVLKARRPYFVMPFIEEGSLASHIRSRGPMPGERVVTVASQMASALAYVHDKGITHRDLNPSNILVDGQGQAYLTDFGLSRTVFNDPLTDARREQRIGTTPYMSPAVAMGEAEDTRCDIYAFGAVLYEMLTGKPPYTGTNAEAVIRQIVAGPPPPILSVNPEAPRRLAQIAEGAMGRSLRERYARMADIASDLERVKSGKKPLGPRSREAGEGRGAWKERLQALIQKPLAYAGAAGALAAGYLFYQQSARPALETVQTIRAPGIYRWDDARMGDWDGDRHQELFLVRNGELTIVNELGALLRAPASVASGSRRIALDLVTADAPGRPSQAYVSWISDSGAAIGVFDKTSMKSLSAAQQFTVNKPPRSSDRAGDFFLTAKRIADPDGGGKKQVLSLLTSENPARAAWLHCFDYDSAQLNWTYSLGMLDAPIECGDIDGDGRQEILAGYREANATGGIVALTFQGAILWKAALGGPGSRSTPVLADLNGDRRLDILAWTSPDPDLNSGETQPSQILRLDARGGITGEYKSAAPLSSCLGAALDGGELAVILATDRDGCLHRLDSNLRLIDKRILVPKQHDAVDLRILDVVDLNKNQRPYVVLSSAQCQTMPVPNARRRADLPRVALYGEVTVRLLDASLREVASQELMRWSKEPRQIGFYVADWSSGSDPVLVFCADAVWLLRLINGQK